MSDPVSDARQKLAAEARSVAEAACEAQSVAEAARAALLDETEATRSLVEALLQRFPDPTEE